MMNLLAKFNFLSSNCFRDITGVPQFQK